MESVTELREFTYDDMAALRKNGYGKYSMDELRGIVDTWHKKVHDGNYFEMLAVVSGYAVVGSVSLYARSANIVSCGVEIYPEYIRKGFACTALGLALEKAKNAGYKIVVSQIRSDHAASIALHEKLGFESDGYEYVNKKGNKVLVFLKSLVS